MQAIGIYGGTFDPIHYGHLRTAQETMIALGLGSVRLLPAGSPPLRAAPVASPVERVAMVKRALVEFPDFSVDDREIHRAGPSFTVTTLESLRAELGASTPLCLLLGMDAFLGLPRWHQWQRLPELAHLVVMQRPGYGVDSLPAWARARLVGAETLAAAPTGGLVFQTVRPQDISGSEIRARLARGESVEGMLPKAVIDYIYSKGIYGRLDRGA